METKNEGFCSFQLLWHFYTFAAQEFRIWVYDSHWLTWYAFLPSRWRSGPGCQPVEWSFWGEQGAYSFWTCTWGDSWCLEKESFPNFLAFAHWWMPQKRCWQKKANCLTWGWWLENGRASSSSCDRFCTVGPLVEQNWRWVFSFANHFSMRAFGHVAKTGC